ncbi:aspartate/glutamate racemase family protein [Streptomyces sp. SID13588]|uniref:glutamate racemase n=1 Tax=Streptomyces sp. SID13588 TaxID=2706051 RepID=UPI0013CCE8B4|nr:glutamate racemase [Streptomyces sp. SID13588]
MTIGLIDSGLGLLPTAGWIRHMDPEREVILLLDPDGAPWGPRSAAFIANRVLRAAEHAVRLGAQALVLSCNTASVTALEVLRAEFEPAVPVIGTVPAVKPAAVTGAPFAVWATEATTASPYQERLISEFAPDQTVARVACPALAEAIDRGGTDAIDAAIAYAVARTPGYCTSVVLGCTHYPLVADRIRARLPAHTTLYDTAEAVARQTLRRLAALNSSSNCRSEVRVLLSGREGVLPAAARTYPLGAALADGAPVSRELLVTSGVATARPFLDGTDQASRHLTPPGSRLSPVSPGVEGGRPPPDQRVIASHQH